MKMICRQKIGNILAIVATLLITCTSMLHGEISVAATLDNTIIEPNEPFTFTVNITGENEAFSFRSKDISMPPIDGIEVVNSFTSSSNSFSMINGKTTSTKNVAVKYQLVLTDSMRKSIVIPQVSVTINGKTYTTESITAAIGAASSVKNTIQSGDDVFIEAVVSKDSMYMYEKCTLEYYLYVKNSIGFGNIQLRSKNGFDDLLIEPVFDLFSNKDEKVTPVTRMINGVRYREYKLVQYDTICKKSGKIKIPELVLEGILRKNDPIFDDDFFNMNSSSGKKVTIASRYKTIMVSPLPAGRPDDFGNIVCGDLKVYASANIDELKTGEALTYTVEYSGDLFLPVIQAPGLSDGGNFEIYKPEAIKGSNGIAYKYLIIPKVAGEFQLPVVSTTYFNTVSKKYETVRSDILLVKVFAGDDDYYSSTRSNDRTFSVAVGDVAYIRPFKETIAFFKPVSGELWYKLIFIPVFVLLCVFFYRLLYERRLVTDSVFNKSVTASSMVRIWEKQAKTVKGKDLYSYAYNFLIKYLTTKCDIPETVVTVTEMCEYLAQQKVKTGITDEIRALFTIIESGRFAPSANNESVAFIKRMSTLIAHFERGEIR